jgi:hypothetical protein
MISITAGAAILGCAVAWAVVRRIGPDGIRRYFLPQLADDEPEPAALSFLA